ncbi:acyltransferase [Paenibacillus sp. FSL H7-0323]|uniref:acyltransferase n=1 Tax=Paenibacillus sp. FSL H7-0323 TaxID=2921433 RepID=UPI0030FC506F
MRPFFKKCGRNFQIASGVTLNVSRNMEIGDDVYIAHNCWINASGGLTIGNGVIISPMVVIATTKHMYQNGRISEKSENAPIKIGDYSWISSNSVITCGTTIGTGCIVAACSSVVKDVGDFWLVGGVPAKPIHKLYTNETLISE